MGAFTKLIDAILFLFFVVTAVGVPLLNSQIVLPPAIYPEILISLMHWYSREFGDFLFHEKPNFFVGFIWLELFFQWPLALLNLYALLGSKPWFNTTCLMYGVSVFTAMAAILPELLWSGKAFDKMLMVYCPYMGLGVLATIRGLMPYSRKNGGGGGVTLVGGGENCFGEEEESLISNFPSFIRPLI